MEPARIRSVEAGPGGDRVVPDPRTAQPAVAPRDAPDGGLAEDVIDVHEDGEPVRRRAERPHQVADAIDVPAPGRSGQALPQPVDAHPLVARAAGQLRQRHGIRGDRFRIASHVSHVTLARQNSNTTPTGPAYHLIRPLV